MLDFVASGIRANKFGHRIAFYLLHFLLLFLFCFFFLLISATSFFLVTGRLHLNVNRIHTH